MQNYGIISLICNKKNEIFMKVLQLSPPTQNKRRVIACRSHSPPIILFFLFHNYLMGIGANSHHIYSTADRNSVMI